MWENAGLGAQVARYAVMERLYGVLQRQAMRLVIAIAAVFLAVAPAAAAPTCQTRAGVTVRCDVASAMPVGWTAPEGERATVPASDPNNGWRALAIVALLLALIALLPEFDGRQSADWGRQEGDDEG
jgi:hypothetical protein